MIDANHDHLSEVVVDSIEDAVGATTSGVDTGKFAAERLSDALRVRNQGARQELERCSRGGLRQGVLERSDGRRGHDEFIGLVQNTTRKSDSMIRDDIINLAFDHGYEIDDTDIYSEVVGDELRFHVSYEVELGIAGWSYIWHKKVSAITTGGAYVGVPQGIEHMPNSPNMRPTYGKSVKNRAKTSADKMNQRLKNR